MVDRKYADRDIDALMDVIKILTPLTPGRRRTVLAYAWESINLTEGEKVPEPDAPKPEPKKRKPRAALGSSPLKASADDIAYGERVAAGNAGISTTGPDGEDLLEIPQSMRK